MRDMVTGLVRVVRRHPGPSLAAAVVAGFVVGRTFARR
jgi:hypothetical protein